MRAAKKAAAAPGSEESGLAAFHPPWPLSWQRFAPAPTFVDVQPILEPNTPVKRAK